MAGSMGGPSQESLNASIPEQPRRRDKAPGASGRDAGESAGLENGLYMKEGFATTDGTKILGKPIPGSGTPPWDAPLESSVGGPAVSDTFGGGGKHTFKNG